MANRHKDFNELVASEFEDLEFSQAYVTTLINEEGMGLEDTLRVTITSMGLQAFADRAELSIQYVSDFVQGRKKISTKSIDKYLQKVFGLRVKMSVESVGLDVA